MEKSVKILNPTTKDFSERWGGEYYTIEAGKGAVIPDYVAIHLKKKNGDLEIQEIDVEAEVLSDEEKPKRKGRPKGSKNKPKTETSEVEAEVENL